MSGCLRRVGCLVLLLVLLSLGWFTRGLWWERVTGRPLEPEQSWHAVPASGGAEVSQRVQSLRRPEGEAFVSLTPAEVGTLLLGPAAARLPESVSDLATSISGEHVSLRATLDLARLRGVEDLGPIASLLTARRQVTITGRPDVVRPGTGELRVERVTVSGVEVPPPVVGSLLRQLDRSASGSTGRSITFSLPPYIGDIRVARGHVILYKNTP